MSRVVVAAIEDDIDRSLAKVFDPFGGLKGLLAERDTAFIKVNAIDSKPYCFTDPGITAAVIGALKEAGARKVYVMDNCTQGNFTRLVFRASGLEEAVKAAGGTPLYLDEGRQVEIELPTLGYEVGVSTWVKDNLIDRREENFYLNLPKLKTHSMATVTLGVKNQFGLIRQADRMRDHNWKLHQKFADIYRVIKPDFTLIEGTYASNHGHYSPEALVEHCVERLGVILGGEDTLAVDAVGTDLMGIRPQDVEHLRLAAEDGEGTIDLDRIEVIGNRNPFRRRYTHELLPIFPEDVRIIEGRERCCREGCNLNTRMVLQMLYLDFKGKGGFTICMGKGFDQEELSAIEGRVMLAGGCATDEAFQYLVNRLGRRSVKASKGCNNLRDDLACLASLMKVSPLKMVPLPPWESTALLLKARLHRSTARITPIFPR
jgi:uncharacterized protein (DUF362 family)